jgi:hypothetical protein
MTETEHERKEKREQQQGDERRGCDEWLEEHEKSMVAYSMSWIYETRLNTTE